MGKEVGTLRELGVKPGDVVEWPGMSKYTVNDDGSVISHCHNIKLNGGIDYAGDQFRIISRASDTPKTWGEMTDAEKGELLLGWQAGGQLQYWDSEIYDWLDTDIDPTEFDADAYRIRPEPKRETVTLYGHFIEGSPPYFDNGMDSPTNKIQFDTIGGKPITGTFRNDDGDVIAVEEIQ